jgi:exodeoxyribonuclease VII small subunit
MSTESNAQPIDEAQASFEEVLTRLERVVESLEKGDLPLEASLSIFEEGVRLSRAGAKRLDEAERRVEQLLASNDGLVMRPLDDSAEGRAGTTPTDPKEPGSQ